MIQKLQPYVEYHDARGSLIGIINQGQWVEMNLVSSLSGTIRGNHYHQTTQELFIVLEGEIEVSCQQILGGFAIGEIETSRFLPGDVFIVSPMVNHVFKVLSPAKWINALSQIMDSQNPDLHRPG